MTGRLQNSKSSRKAIKLISKRQKVADLAQQLFIHREVSMQQAFRLAADFIQEAHKWTRKTSPREKEIAEKINILVRARHNLQYQRSCLIEEVDRVAIADLDVRLRQINEDLDDQEDDLLKLRVGEKF